MKSSFEELLRDLQIISKELFPSSWNLVSTKNLNTAFPVIPLEFQEIKQQPFLWHSLLFLVRPSSMKMRRAKGPKSYCPILYPIAQKALSPLTQKEIRD